jgi:hypothetical protein
MNDSNPSSPIAGPRRAAWNKGKLTGPKPPLRPGHVWSIRAKLQLERRMREVATWSPCVSTTWRPTGTRSTGQPSARGKLVDPFGSS